MPKSTNTAKRSRVKRIDTREITLGSTVVKTSIGVTPYDIEIETSKDDCGGASLIPNGTGNGGKISVTAYAPGLYRHGAGTILHEILESWMAEKGHRLYRTHSLTEEDPSACRFYLEHKDFQQMCDECSVAISQAFAAFADLYGRERACKQLALIRNPKAGAEKSPKK